MRKLLILIMTVALFRIPSAAAESGDTVTEPIRPVMSAYMLEAGASHLADTYLSPLKFSGWHVGFSYERMQAMKFSPEKWVMQMRLRLIADNAKTQRKTTQLWYWGLDFSWAMMHRWRLPYNITLGAGGAAMLDAGCVYNPRNGNNPASAKASITLGGSGYAAWNTTLFGIPMTLRYQAMVPLIGAFFSPDYGELYYEIYLGNHSGLAHCAWPGNFRRLDNLLTADIHFGSTSLRIGYSGSILSTKINHIVSHIFTHAAVVGISGEWLSVNPRKPLSAHAKMISSLF